MSKYLPTNCLLITIPCKGRNYNYISWETWKTSPSQIIKISITNNGQTHHTCFWGTASLPWCSCREREKGQPKANHKQRLDTFLDTLCVCGEDETHLSKTTSIALFHNGNPRKTEKSQKNYFRLRFKRDFITKDNVIPVWSWIEPWDKEERLLQRTLLGQLTSFANGI